jgi:hypothetical protein
VGACVEDKPCPLLSTFSSCLHLNPRGALAEEGGQKIAIAGGSRAIQTARHSHFATVQITDIVNMNINVLMLCGSAGCFKCQQIRHKFKAKLVVLMKLDAANVCIFLFFFFLAVL